MTIYYKVLDKNRMPLHGGKRRWPKPGEWRSVSGRLIPCENAIHACRRQDLLYWLGPTIWTIEFADEPAIDGNQVYGRTARLVENLATWNERTARLFAADCAEHVLHLFERYHPDDSRPREAIEAARAFADGTITAEELAAAQIAARSAAQAAARGFAQDAAWAVAWAAAWAAAGAVEWVAAGVAEWAAAEATEHAWQTARLFDYLEGGRTDSAMTTLESFHRGHRIYVSDEGTYDPDWETRTIYHHIETPDGRVVMDGFVGDTGDTLETYLEIMKTHVDASLVEPGYWDGDEP